MPKENAVKFMGIASKSHANIAGEMSDAIKEVVYRYSDRIPLSLAIGVIEITKLEILAADKGA